MLEINQELINQCLAGKEKAIKELYMLCFNDMYKVSARYGGHPEDIQEIINLSFMKILKGIKDYKHDQKFGNWIRTITINTALDKVRAKQKKMKIFSDQNIEFIEHESQTQFEFDTSLEVQDIFKMMRLLPETHRIVLNLFIIEGFTHKEIATKLNIKETSSRYYLSEARKLMKEIITTQNKNAYERAKSL
jgi:RNA polymerase sigma-70 factor (ECF subfamily)